jgi:hypothetical protein
VTARSTVKDDRAGMGQPAAHIEVPTFGIPSDCHALCSWVVVRPGVGKLCVSRLKYANGLCRHRHTATALGAGDGNG